MRRLALRIAAVACEPDWHGKDAHRRCAEAIADDPVSPAPPCGAMTMCANEAELSSEQSTKLRAMMRRSGCAEP